MTDMETYAIPTCAPTGSIGPTDARPGDWRLLPKGSPEREDAIRTERRARALLNLEAIQARRLERKRRREACLAEPRAREAKAPASGPVPRIEPAQDEPDPEPHAPILTKMPPPRRWNLCQVCRRLGHPNCPRCTVANDPHLAFVNGHVEKVEHQLGEHPNWLRCLACREPYPFSYDPRCRVRDPETGEPVPISPYATTTLCPWCVWNAEQARRREGIRSPRRYGCTDAGLGG
jgi:hypothetical protein